MFEYALPCIAVGNKNADPSLSGYRPFNGGQKLFSIEDFDSGRVSFPEEGMRGLRQVVKSNDQNIEQADHVWTHQMTHGPVEYQEWPLEMPGVGDGKTAAAPSPAFKAHMQVLAASGRHSKAQMQLSSKLDEMQRTAALDMGKVGNELQAATQMLLNRPQHAVHHSSLIKRKGMHKAGRAQQTGKM